MNSLSVIGGRGARWPVLDAVASSFDRAVMAAKILISAAISVDARGPRTKAARPSAAPLAMERSEVVPLARSRGGADTLGRFQREIVPQLDAAYNFARFLSRDADAAQDIVQDAFLRAYRGFDGYQGGDARAWIFSIVRNCYYNWLLQRRRKARIEVDVGPLSDDAPGYDVAADDDTPEMALLRRSESQAVRGVLNALPRALREMLVLRELEGLSYREIAEIAALPIGTVMSRLARARQQFLQAWQLRGGGQESGA